MRTLHQTATVQTFNSLKRRFLLFCFLTGATTLLLSWLSIGFAPSTWWLLFQAIKQFSVLWTYQRTQLLWSLPLLVFQSLLLLQAWVLLIRVAVREGSHFYAILSGKALPVTATPALASPASMPASPTTTVPPSSLRTSEQILQPVQAVPASDQSLKPTLLPPPPMSLEKEQAYAPPRPMRQTGLASSKQMAEAADLMQSLTEPPTQMMSLPSSDTYVSAWEIIPDNAVQPPFSSQPSTFTSERDSAIEQIMPTPFDEPANGASSEEFNPYVVNDVFELEEQTSLSELRSIRQDKLVSDDIDIPAATEKNMLEQFQQETLQEQAAESETQSEQPVEEQDQLFVFGNPFEGPLPDVFEHDEDLKRSIQEGIELPSGQGLHNQPGDSESSKSYRPKPSEKHK